MTPAWKKDQLNGGNGTPVVDDRGGIDVSIVGLEEGK